MSSEEIRKSFLEFFKSKGHKIVPSSSLIPDDESVLLTTAGMQQFKKYYTGELDAKKDVLLENGEPAIGVASIQKCFRTSDIDEVGDETHLTFFEMLGNFSFGGYFKKEAIEYAHEFITKELKLKIDYVSVFGGDEEDNIPLDKESEEIWKKIDSNVGIRKAGKKDNFWGPTGNEGPCGPTTEIYINGVEVWNIVFNEYYRDKNGKFIKSENPGVDTGMGLERLATMLQGKKSVFETDLFDVLKKDEFNNSLLPEKLSERFKRIILDHSRGMAFLISDGVRPSNKGTGYVLRRLMRRAIVYEFLSGDSEANIEPVLIAVIRNYKKFYPELEEEIILPVFYEENSRFLKTIQSGLKELDKIADINAKLAFKLYETYGLPYEIIKELGGIKATNLNRGDFDREFEKHQELSRTASAGMFKGGLADASEQTIKYHTAAHLMLAALRKVFGENVLQKGSNITSERLRFDFSYSEKVTPEQIKQIEDLVNEKIKQDLPVVCEELSLEEAKEKGAMGVFDSKYGDRVKVYTIDDFSREICGGPHVNRTSELGKFKIIKEESASAGVRRIKAILE